MSLQTIDITKIYGKQKALDGISFSIKSNGIVGFLGPNGAGKTTTMKILTGIITADGGRSFVNGIDPQKHPLEVKRMTGYLPENNPLYLDMYVVELLSYEADIHRVQNKKKRIQEVIALTGLINEKHKKVGQLSKGYRQRVGIAMAIIHDPDVLILDEPTSGLDPNQIVEIRSLIKILGKEKTVLLSTHLMQEVEAICDEVIILHQGKIKDHFALADISKRYPGKTIEQIFIDLTSQR